MDKEENTATAKKAIVEPKLKAAQCTCKNLAVSDYRSLHSGTIPDSLEEVWPGQDG